MAAKRNKGEHKFQGRSHNMQSNSKTVGGENRNGRLSQFKNHNTTGEGVPNEYISMEDD